MRGFPSFHLQQVGSSAGVAGPVASSLDGQHHHLVPMGDDGGLDTEGGGLLMGVLLPGKLAVGWQLVGRLVVCYP